MNYIGIVVAGLLMALPATAQQKKITGVEPIRVESPVGTVPRLPYQVWVTYSDGTREYRQTRWSNAALATEQQQADERLYPAGKEYRIEGWVTGDNTTNAGYPITAQVTVTDRAYDVPAAQTVAEPLPLDCVTLEGDNRLTANRELAIRTPNFLCSPLL